MPKVTFLPASVALGLLEPANIISIRGPYDSFPEFVTQPKKLLQLTFIPFGIACNEQQKEKEFSTDQCRQVVEFVESVRGEDIIVHCGEGRMRSPSIALFIEYMYGREDDAYELDTKFPGCIKSVEGRDRELFFKLLDYWNERQEERELEVSQ